MPDGPSWSDGSDTGDADEYIDMKSFLKGRGQTCAAVSEAGNSSKREVDGKCSAITYTLLLSLETKKPSLLHIVWYSVQVWDSLRESSVATL